MISKCELQCDITILRVSSTLVNSHFPALQLVCPSYQWKTIELSPIKASFTFATLKGTTTAWYLLLTHWGRVTHICISKLSIIGSDDGLSPDRRQVIIWTNDGILLIGTLGTNFNEILIEIHTFSFKNIHLKMSSGNGVHFVSASMC